MQKNRFALTLAALVCVIITLSGSATASPGWRYTSSHGMAHCAFAAFGPGGATVNTATTSAGNGGVTVTGEFGQNVTLRLICERAQSYDSQGQLSNIGAEGTYSGPGGAGVTVGAEKPGDSSDGYSFPKGREWAVAVGAQPVTHQLSWAGTAGSDALSVTVQPIAPPPSLPTVQGLIAPVQQDATAARTRADEAWDKSDRGWEDRIFAFQLQYQLGLDSLGNDGDARQGWGLDANVFLGSDPNVRFLTGATFGMDFRQKAVVAAPNMATNGYNSFVDWKTYYVGPKLGVEWMPTSWFQLQAWGSVGALISVDGTIPISQLPDRTLYSGESDSTPAFGYRASLQPGFVIAEHLVLGANIGLMGNFTKLPKERGPEQVCNQTTGDCLVRRDGHFLDVPLGFFIGGQL